MFSEVRCPFSLYAANPTLFSISTKPPIVPSAPWKSALPTLKSFTSLVPPFLSSPSFHPQSQILLCPPPTLLHPHLVSVLQMSHYWQVLWELKALLSLCFTPSAQDLRLDAVGMCPVWRSIQSTTHTQLVFSVGRKQQYYGVRTDGCQFSSSFQ